MCTVDSIYTLRIALVWVVCRRRRWSTVSWSDPGSGPGSNPDIRRPAACKFLASRIYLYLPACLYLYSIFACLDVYLFKCLLVCMFVFTCLFVCLLVWMFAFACLYVCMFTCLHTCSLVCMLTCSLARIFACLLVCLPTCLHVYLFACSLVCMFTCLHARLFTCLFVCLLVWKIAFACSHVCMFTCLLARLFACLLVHNYIGIASSDSYSPSFVFGGIGSWLSSSNACLRLISSWFQSAVPGINTQQNRVYRLNRANVESQWLRFV